MRRVISLWLPTFATDRLHRRRTRRRLAESAIPGGRPPTTPRRGSGGSPLATVVTAHGGVRVVAVNPTAAAAGIAPGMPLAEARAVLPNLIVGEADPAADRIALETLADWCVRYTPWTAVDASSPCVAGPSTGVSIGAYGGDAGLWLDITGCAHLFGGEDALLADLVDRLSRFGLGAAAAAAEAPGAAWATARFGGVRTRVVPSGAVKQTLAPLPVAGLRLPAATVTDLDLVGLRRIGDLMALPRAPLAARFGDTLPKQLDRALGRADEPVSPRRPVPAFHSRLAFADPIGRPEDIAATTARLLADLCCRLEAARHGVRRLELALFRTDGTVARAGVGTGRPVRDPDHLARLFREKLDGLDPGFGIETAILAATVTDPLAPEQTAFAMNRGGESEGESREVGEDLARLLDRLGNRLHPDNVVRLAPQASHLPERACRPVPAAIPSSIVSDSTGPNSARNPRSEDWDPGNRNTGDQRTEEDHRPRQPRPPALFPTPEPVQVVASLPDGPPVLLQRGRARHRIVAAEGPERIAPEWWREDDGLSPNRLATNRDYYRVEDESGRRFWVFREGAYRAYTPPRWYLHGLFG